jgi:hypothetical protein
MTEADEIAALDKGARAYLGRRKCDWCDGWRLDRPGCGAVWDVEACTPEFRAERRRLWLKGYRPAPREMPERGGG